MSCEVCNVKVRPGRSRCDEHPRYKRADPGTCNHCGRKAYRLKVCYALYKALPKAQECPVEGCDQPSYSQKVPGCVTHYNRWRRTGSVADPEIVQLARGTCYQCESPVGPRTLFCNNRCRKRFNVGRSEQPIECLTCHEKIPATASTRKVFCSKRCADLARTSKRASTTDGTVTPANIKALHNFYGERCLNPLCDREDRRISKDHVVPVSKGGPDSIFNLQPLCLTCNIKKGVNTVDYRPDKGVDFRLLILATMEIV